MSSLTELTKIQIALSNGKSLSDFNGLDVLDEKTIDEKTKESCRMGTQSHSWAMGTLYDGQKIIHVKYESNKIL